MILIKKISNNIKNKGRKYNRHLNGDIIFSVKKQTNQIFSLD